MSTNKQIEELEKQLAKMKAEAAAEAAAKQQAQKSCLLHGRLLSELSTENVIELLHELDKNSKEQTLRLIDVDYYLQKRAANYPNLPPIPFSETGVGEYGLTADEFAHRNTSGLRLVYENFTIECVDQEGGGEGEGEHWHSVIKAESRAVPGSARYFYIPGYYASYDGTTIDYDYAFEVEPFEKVVIDWKRK